METSNIAYIDKDYTPEKAQKFQKALLDTIDRMQASLNVERHELAVLLNNETSRWLGRETSAWGPVLFLIKPQINRGKVYVMRVSDVPAALRAAP